MLQYVYIYMPIYSKEFYYNKCVVTEAYYKGKLEVAESFIRAVGNYSIVVIYLAFLRSKLTFHSK